MEIHAMFADPKAEVACPRCGGPLILASPEGGETGVGRDVICTGCRGRMHIPDSAVAR
jgi:ribosomal protein S27E